ncbi:hypothetical protein HN827_09270 [archaeon]|jgi:hypothetical protein|nr:hypothetical protein [archaeon]MBT7392990.1 hypothetical protein [archaeon]
MSEQIIDTSSDSNQHRSTRNKIDFQMYIAIGGTMVLFGLMGLNSAMGWFDFNIPFPLEFIRALNATGSVIGGFFILSRLFSSDDFFN